MGRRIGFALALGAVVFASAAAQTPPAERRSGFETMGPAAQAMQRDDFANPAMLVAAQGEALWSMRPEGAGPNGGKSCAECHGAPGALKGVAARYPAYDAASGRAIDLAGRIQHCRTARQNAPALARESPALLALETLVALQSRGEPIKAPEDMRLAPALAEGQSLFTRRMGQLDLSCAQCHDDNAGRSLGGSTIPQGHPTGYPVFRLEWQGVGSLQRRLRGCMTGIRAEAFAPGARELIALEVFLKSRAAGMALDAPGVRP